MTFPPLSRRTLLGAAAMLGPLLRATSAAGADPILSAIQRTETADLTFARAALPAGAVLDEAARAAHRSNRAALGRARFLAQTLH